MIENREQNTKKKSRLGFFIGIFVLLFIVVSSLGLFWLNRQPVDQQMLSSIDNFIGDLNGYVLLEFFQYSLETTVPILILGVLITYILIRIVVVIWRSPRIIRGLLANRSTKRTKRLLNESLLLLSKGELVKARKKLKSANSTSRPILQTFLLSIELEIESGNTLASNDWVERAVNAFPEAAPYILGYASNLLIKKNYFIDARSYVDQLMEANPKNPLANQLLFRIINGTHDHDLMLRKIFEFSDHVNDDELAHTIHTLVKDAITNNKPLEAVLERIPKSIEKHPLILTSKIEAWISNQEYLKAEAALKKQIPSSWNQELILLYAELGNDKVSELSTTVDKWLEERPKDSNLWLVASRLAQKDGLWSKAQQCIERAIDISPTSETYTELALILSELGEKEKASEALSLARQISG